MNIQILGQHGGDILARVAPGVLDHDVDGRLCDEFLNDPRHHLAVAVDAGIVVGMATGVHHVHPDKQPQLWINEVGVAPTHRSQGLGRQLLGTLLEVGRQIGCTEAWVLTDRSNGSAMRMYKSCGGEEDPGELVMFTFKFGSGGGAADR